MGYGIIDTSTLTDIADAIRGKLGVQTTYKPSEMPEAIESISGDGITPTGTKSITANGTYDVASYASAEVNVPSSGITPSGTKQINITSNGTTTEDVTAYADAQITVNVPTGSTPTGTKNISITQNGTTTEDVANYANAEISVNVVNEDYEDALVALGVTEDLTDGIEALTAYANGVTGESDTTLSDAVASLADGYGQGSGYTGIEVKTDSNGYITDYIFHGFSEIPKYALNYASYSRAPSTGIPVISFADKPTSCGIMAFNKVTASIEWSGLSELEKVEGEYALAPNYSPGNNQSAQIVNLPKFKGYVDNTYSAQNVFRMQSNNYPYAPLTYNLPVCEIIPQYAWYNLAGTGVSITLGSIGHAVTASKQQPFGATSQASGTVTIYTDGAHLDAVKTAVQAGAGSNLAFVYKASEATTYNGTSYQAGDTITV